LKTKGITGIWWHLVDFKRPFSRTRGALIQEFPIAIIRNAGRKGTNFHIIVQTIITSAERIEQNRAEQQFSER
jgi:hypothetical protein